MVRFWRRKMAFSGIISAGGDGSKLENAKWGVGLAPSGGVFGDDLSHGLPYLQLLT
ncbi:hypothetical protein Tco_0288621, partial [Tanacetum coccineum]